MRYDDGVMFNSAYEVGRVFGVPIRLDLSLLLLAGWLWLQAGSLLVGLLVAVLLLASVLLHELGHTVASLRLGYRVRDITLAFMGGQATLQEMPRQPWKEIVVTAAGLLVSLGLWQGGVWTARLIAGGGAPLPALLLYWLGLINKWLLLFNLLPAFPMDGGRLLRAALSHRLGRRRGTYIAMRVGRAFALLMGLYGLFHGRLTLVVIAVLVYLGAGAEYRAVLAESPFGTGGLGPFGAAEPPPEDQVIVSPPPYRRGRDVSDLSRWPR